MSLLQSFKKNIYLVLLLSNLILFTTNVKGQFVTNGTAIQLDSICYQLTPAVPTSIASIWKEDQISLSNSFDLRFNLNFGCTDVGADGIVFVLNTSTITSGGSGGDIGYGSNFNPSLGVEFDTYTNIDNADLAADHIAMVRDGNLNHNNPNNLAGPVNTNATENNIEDCEYHPVRIIWDTESMLLEVYFDCLLRLSYTGDIINDIFGGDPMVYWGFTASTGGETNVQSVCFDSFESTLSVTNQTFTICAGEEVQLTGSQQNLNYSWTPNTSLNNSNIIDPIASPTESITYVGNGADECENEFIDTFNIIVNPLAINFEIQPAFSDTTLCEGEIFELTLQTDIANNILWQDGSSDLSMTVSQAGLYEVVISNECSSTAVSMEVAFKNCLVSMPNAFTPDSDGLNDLFAPVSEGSIEILQFKIFNRWGAIVFDEINPQGWDGTYKDNAAPSDVYVYTIEFIDGNGTREIRSGDVTLVR
jgi:gliding motility-associated-like protein